MLSLLIVAVGCGSSTPESEGASSDETAVAPETESGGESGGSMYDEDATEDVDAIAQEEWDAQEGDAWDEFSSGYLAGWESGCDIAFEGSPDGDLYDQGEQYSADDCYQLAPWDAADADYPIYPPDDPYYEGELLGETDGCVAAFDELSSYGVLNWGEDSFDDSVCP
jgi:hypothetical protein